MTPFDLTRLCPPPEGMEWAPDENDPESLVAEVDGGRVSVRGWGHRPLTRWQVIASKNGNFITLYATEVDLPSTYRRALQAVGLASPWTSEVPTEAGRYLVEEPEKEVTCWNLLEDGRWSHSSWATFVLGLVPFSSGSLFMPCPQPPKERP